jgi:hypothetical protein
MIYTLGIIGGILFLAIALSPLIGAVLGAMLWLVTVALGIMLVPFIGFSIFIARIWRGIAVCALAALVGMAGAGIYFACNPQAGRELAARELARTNFSGK